jgi:sodium-dependent phosphate cotransporter
MTAAPAGIPQGDRTMPTPLRALLVLALIYCFLIGVSALEQGIKLMGEDVQEQLFSGVSNPIAGLSVGILGTVLVQSSSASTSVIVGLVASGAISVDAAVPMIMGANIGTTVTNTLVSLGHVRHSDEFRRAFAAATVHDFFNVMAVAVLLPLELTTGLVSNTAEWISRRLVGSAGSDWESPIKRWVKEPVAWLQDLWEAVGVHVAMLLGVIVTMLVQSSSITTSILIPLAAAGVLTLRNAYPVTLGANVGTTVTALLAALAASSPDSLTVALTHTTFNLLGILLLYVPPFIRYVPVMAAERLADVAVNRRILAVTYVFGVFIVLPLVALLAFG